MNEYVSEKFRNLQKVATQHAEQYQKANPFPSIYFENFFDEAILNKVHSEFPDLASQHSIQFDDHRQKKFAGKGELSFGPKMRAFLHYLNSGPFIEFIETITGIKEPLLGDPCYRGGGLHEIKPGGLLKVHADFNKDRRTGLDRRINVLVYLNKNWKDSYGGHLELWNKEMTECVSKVPPTFNTLAMFSTTDFSYHGHPDPLTCPGDRSRRSLALYYYSNGRPADEVNPGHEDHSTLFQIRAGNRSDQQPPLGISEILRRTIINLTPPIVIKCVKRLLR